MTELEPIINEILKKVDVKLPLLNGIDKGLREKLQFLFGNEEVFLSEKCSYICPYSDFIRPCNYALLTKDSPTKLDCYICINNRH